MHRGATPTLICDFNIPIDTLTGLSVVFAQKGNIILEKTLQDVEIVDDKTMNIYLTEAETLSFETDDLKRAYVDVQFRMAYGDKRVASDIMQVIIKPIMKDGAL